MNDQLDPLPHFIQRRIKALLQQQTVVEITVFSHDLVDGFGCIVGLSQQSMIANQIELLQLSTQLFSTGLETAKKEIPLLLLYLIEDPPPFCLKLLASEEEFTMFDACFRIEEGCVAGGGHFAEPPEEAFIGVRKNKCVLLADILKLLVELFIEDIPLNLFEFVIKLKRGVAFTHFRRGDFQTNSLVFGQLLLMRIGNLLTLVPTHDDTN